MTVDTGIIMDYQISIKNKPTWRRVWIILLTGLMMMNCAVISVSATIFSEDGSNLTRSDLYNLTNSSDAVTNNSSAVFFYDPECGACLPVHAYMETYLADHPDIELDVVNLSTGQEATDRLDKYYIMLNREWENIPVVFIGPVGLEGTQEILDNFDGLFTWYCRNAYPGNSSYNLSSNMTGTDGDQAVVSAA
ncbi:MAG: hypothetical protein LUQ50_04400 [Methanospirillum sp.]|uniref:hypothetical protein n=1 Tax=Methanospirillum sp. TaxID=45200 RepID=UPI00236C6721|nr:hypothetical protein [Methanospirillum sp.]MDD1728296.1 hypothetical protein [Methanospirillum sp.]